VFIAVNLAISLIDGNKTDSALIAEKNAKQGFAIQIAKNRIGIKMVTWPTRKAGTGKENLNLSQRSEVSVLNAGLMTIGRLILTI